MSWQVYDAVMSGAGYVSLPVFDVTYYRPDTNNTGMEGTCWVTPHLHFSNNYQIQVQCDKGTYYLDFAGAAKGTQMFSCKEVCSIINLNAGAV